MTAREFRKLVEAGIDDLPDHILARMQNVALVIAAKPTREQRKRNGVGKDEVLFGLYEGIPQTERGVEYQFVLPDKISIFREPILAAYETPEDIRTCVSNTVWHEIAHHFGMDEHQVREEERKRGKEM